MMNKSLSGVRADHSRSYQQLERVAEHAREQLKFEPDEADQSAATFLKTYTASRLGKADRT